MAKAKGHRANKPNDSFGTINNPNLYRGAYKEDVYKDDEEQLEAQETDPSEEATPEEQGFSSKKEEVDYKKRYDDLKRHYDASWQSGRTRRQNSLLKEKVQQNSILLLVSRLQRAWKS